MKKLILLAYALTFTVGLVNAVTVMGLGDLFASVMTGNVVFIGLSLAGAGDFSALRPGLAIVAFLAGAAAGGRLAVVLEPRALRAWLVPVAAIEASLLLASAAVAMLFVRGSIDTSSSPAVLAIIALTSMAMGIRNATITRLSIPDLKTTVMTLTLTSLAADSVTGKRQHAVRRAGSVALLGTGAAAGALLWRSAGIAVPLVAAAAIILIATVLFAGSADARRPLADL